MNRRILWVVLLMAALVGVSEAAERKRGYMGVTLASVSQHHDGSVDKGIVVVRVLPGSGAEAAGLQPQDRLTSINGIQVSSSDEIHRVLEDAGPSDTATVTLDRDGTRQTVKIVLGEAPEPNLVLEPHVRHHHHEAVGHEPHREILVHSDEPTHGEPQEGRWAVIVDEKRAYLGVHTQRLNPQLAAYFGVDGGLLVTEVFEDSPAAEAGIQAGDVLRDVSDMPVRETGSLHRALAKVEPGELIEIHLQRRGQPLTEFVEVGDWREHSSTVDLRLHRLHEVLQGNSAEATIELFVPEVDTDRHVIRKKDVKRDVIRTEKPKK